MTTEHKNIDEAILAVISAAPTLEKTGTLQLGNSKIKTLTNDEVLDKIKPITIEHGIVIYPTLVSDTPIVSFGGTPRNLEGGEADDTKVRPIRINRLLQYDFEFLHVASGTSRTIRVPGEGMGNDDKGARKATTSAQKTAYILMFELVTGEPDPDNMDATEAPAEKPKLDRGAQQRGIAKTPGTRTAVAPRTNAAAAVKQTQQPEPEQPEPTPESPAENDGEAVAARIKAEREARGAATQATPAQAVTAPSEPQTTLAPGSDKTDDLKSRMRAAVTALGGPQIFTRVEVNALATEATGKVERDDWINTPTLLKKVVEAVEAKANATHDPNEPVA